MPVGKFARPLIAGVVVAIILASIVTTILVLVDAEDPPTIGQDCKRKCVAGENRVCKFEFNVEPYQTLGRACHDCPRNISHCQDPNCLVGDGVQKLIYVVNKQLPGPSIEVCEGDTVIVDVKNHLPSNGVTMHWHGLTLAKSDYGEETPFMDGATGITQCDIPSRGKFKYTFAASIPGTHWWHSHAGFQRGDGLFGPLIIHRPIAADPHSQLYDYDLSQHVILFHDWTHILTSEKFVFRHHRGDDDFPDNILVNGHGTFAGHQVPYSRFNVLTGMRYRLRFISAAVLNCPISIQIRDHIMTVINSDGHDIRPFNTSSLVMHSGERFDVVIKANDNPGVNWITFMGLVDCAESEAHQMAVLHIHDDKKYNLEELNEMDITSKELPNNRPVFTAEKPDGIQINTPNSGCNQETVCLSDLRALEPLPEKAKNAKADHTFYMAFTMRKIHNKYFYDKIYYSISSLKPDDQVPSPQVNNISNIDPFEPLLLQSEEPKNVCNVDNMPDDMDGSCDDEFCECLHLIKIPLGDVVDVVLLDEGPHSDEGHPIHLHGMKFWVVAQDRPSDVDDAKITRDQVIQMDSEGLIQRNLDHPIMKDTIAVPDAGYSVIRFVADNPGYWLLHCHLIFHSMSGMNVILQIGEHDDMPKPPSGFPTCKNFNGV